MQNDAAHKKEIEHSQDSKQMFICKINILPNAEAKSNTVFNLDFEQC